MKTSMILSKYALALTLSATTIFVGCADSKHSLKGTSKTGQAGASDAQGTTDGAGGNGTNGKAYDSYIVNPQTLPAYKEIIEPKIKAMDKIWTEEYCKDTLPEDKDKCGNIFDLTWKFKTWYVAPVSLKTLNKKTIGIEFTDDKTEQLALQTNGEVWIDSKYFNDEKMSLKEQADHIMHEYMMSLYLLKFQKISGLCNVLKKASPAKIDCNDFNEKADYLMKAEAERPLVKQDYEFIRSATAAFMEKGEKMTVQEISNNLIARSFDKRIFGVPNSSNLGFRESEPKSMNEIVASLKIADRTQSIDGACQGFLSKRSVPCGLKVEIKDGDFGSKNIALTIVDKNNGQTLRAINLALYSTIPFDHYATEEKEDIYIVEISEPRKYQEFKEGLKYEKMILVFEKNEFNGREPKLVGLVAANYTTASVTTQKEANNGNEMDCTTATATILPAKDVASDVIVMGKTLQKLESFFLIHPLFTNGESDMARSCTTLPKPVPERTSFNNSAATVN